VANDQPVDEIADLDGDADIQIAELSPKPNFDISTNMRGAI
jgi:hypothetical protein